MDAGGRVEVRLYEGLGTRYAHVKQPTTPIDGALLRLLAAAREHFDAYHGAVTRAQANRHLSPLGVRELTRDYRQRVDNAIPVLHNRARQNLRASCARPRRQRRRGADPRGTVALE